MKPGMDTATLCTHTPALFDAAVKQAAELLRSGALVALPTETVYGLAANAFDSRAVSQLFSIKGRPSNNPIIVHVASLELAKRCVTNWPDVATRLAQAFWPGPLTMVLPRATGIADAVTAGGDTVGVRWPKHPFIQAVIRECGFPLAAPSANLSHSLSPTNAAHVAKQLAGRIPLIVDGGQAQVGIESTVIDLTRHPPEVLRPGMIHDESLIAVTGELVSAQTVKLGQTFKSPGQLPKHYAPRAKLAVLAWQTDAELRAQLGGDAKARRHIITHTHIPGGEDFAGVSVIPHDPEAFARALYAELHRCDDAGAELIVVEALPAGPEWRALADRLKRASAD
jgi:L-threonylcarbamoyladenylate synthase